VRFCDGRSFGFGFVVVFESFENMCSWILHGEHSCHSISVLKTLLFLHQLQQLAGGDKAIALFSHRELFQLRLSSLTCLMFDAHGEEMGDRGDYCLSLCAQAFSSALIREGLSSG
jgi:hypothetical protein